MWLSLQQRFVSANETLELVGSFGEVREPDFRDSAKGVLWVESFVRR